MKSVKNLVVKLSSIKLRNHTFKSGRTTDIKPTLWVKCQRETWNSVVWRVKRFVKDHKNFKETHRLRR